MKVLILLDYCHCCCLVASVLSCFSSVWLCVTLRTVVHQAPLSVGFSSKEYWCGLPRPPPGETSQPSNKSFQQWGFIILYVVPFICWAILLELKFLLAFNENLLLLKFYSLFLTCYVELVRKSIILISHERPSQAWRKLLWPHSNF